MDPCHWHVMPSAMRFQGLCAQLECAKEAAGLPLNSTQGVVHVLYLIRVGTVWAGACEPACSGGLVFIHILLQTIVRAYACTLRRQIARDIVVDLDVWHHSTTAYFTRAWLLV